MLPNDSCSTRPCCPPSERPNTNGRGSRGLARRVIVSTLTGALTLAVALGLDAQPASAQTGGLRQWVKNHFKVGPNYLRPAAPVADAWIESGDRRLVGAPAEGCGWWGVFNDPVLNTLVQSAYDQNLSVKAAGLRVLEARAAAGIARGNVFPQFQQAFGDYQRVELSRNTANNPLAFAPPGSVKRNFDSWAAGFDAAWELDVWGRFRRNVEAADASLDASVESYDEILITLIGDTAATYVQIRAIEQQLQYARENVEIQKGSLELAEVRFRNGATTELDVQQAKNNLANTQGLIPSLQKSLRQTENRLCILLGMPPHDLRYLLGKTGPIPGAPPEVAVGIPCDLLRQRPDVRRAEREVAAQSARIGIAITDLYPAFTIFGQIGVQSEDISDLFTGGSVAGVVGGPSISWNILNYGRIKNNIRIQDARFQQRVVDYQSAVLKANQEVEDALVGFLRTQEQFEQDRAAVAAAKRSVDLALIQYRDGAIDFNRVFTLEGILASQQIQLAATQGQIATNLIGVYKALGGGWQIRLNCGPDAITAVEPAPPAGGAAPQPANGDGRNLPGPAAEGNGAWFGFPPSVAKQSVPRKNAARGMRR